MNCYEKHYENLKLISILFDKGLKELERKYERMDEEGFFDKENSTDFIIKYIRENYFQKVEKDACSSQALFLAAVQTFKKHLTNDLRRTIFKAQIGALSIEEDLDDYEMEFIKAFSKCVL